MKVIKDNSIKESRSWSEQFIFEVWSNRLKKMFCIVLKQKKKRKKSFQSNITSLVMLHIIEKWLKQDSLFSHVKIVMRQEFLNFYDSFGVWKG